MQTNRPIFRCCSYPGHTYIMYYVVVGGAPIETTDVRSRAMDYTAVNFHQINKCIDYKQLHWKQYKE